MGGPVEAARKLGGDATYQAIQSWRSSGVPARWCRKVSELSGVSVVQLRAQDWQDYWPELASAPATQAGEGANV
ncbi:ABC transporter substrate-binding protein [Ottowia flava]|uniref:ABC transporter substrate-binding protein n=1 Tax=Ottowia flava TaxID=2675430 RepID=A0ABW4KMU8_9BURK